MKNKLWIHKRIFITFSIFIILLLNIFSYALYYFITNSFLDDIYKNILREYETITKFIDLEDDIFFSIPEKELKNIDSLWFFTYIWKDDLILSKKYNLWLNYYLDTSEVAFRWDYKTYNIIIWKNIKDLYTIQNNFIKITILLNIFIVFLIFFITYFLTKSLLKPIFELNSFINKYDFKSKKVFKNDYGNSEIWFYINSTNNFLLKVKENIDHQKDFIQDVSHELKTPLMQIDSTIEMIETKITDYEIIKKLSNIKLSVSKINIILSQLSFLLRWDEKWIKSETINLNNYILDFIKWYEDLANTKNLKIELIQNYTKNIFWNKYYLDRLFWNLLINAIDYNNWNWVIKIAINKDYVDIIDNWIGIKQSEINKIFNRFYRSSDSNIYSKNWNWLWLSIVKKICDILNRKIEIFSNDWNWTIFRINC